MKPFKEQSNAILLHGILQGIRNACAIPATDWFDTTPDDQQKIFGMLEMLHKTSYITENVYMRWWQMFPFGTPEYRNLNMVQKDFVVLTFNMIHELSAGYGEKLIDD